MKHGTGPSRTLRPAGAAAFAYGAVFCVALVTSLTLRATSVGLGLPDVINLAPLVATMLVGLLIAVRRPDNRIGWIVCGLGLVLAVQALLSAVGISSAIRGGWLTTALWLDAKSFLFLWGAVIAVLLHFPTGRLPSPRWRAVWWAAVAGVAWGVVFSALKPGPLLEAAPPGTPNPTNPTALPQVYEVIAFIDPIGLLLLLLALLAALASLVVRYRASTGTQRLQIRWVVASCVAFVAALLVNVVVRHRVPAWLDPADAVAGVAFTLIPVAVGIAVLRHRLFDIDRIINRTVVYTAVTVVLGAAYLGLVTAMRAATESVTGDSALAVAASTLAVAALFQPARRRIQQAVDRRFNRARYDAATTVASFSTRLRDEIDLDSLRTELLGVVAATMQPTDARLWLRETLR